jgi:hypothetical protein
MTAITSNAFFYRCVMDLNSKQDLPKLDTLISKYALNLLLLFLLLLFLPLLIFLLLLSLFILFLLFSLLILLLLLLLPIFFSQSYLFCSACTVIHCDITDLHWWMLLSACVHRGDLEQTIQKSNLSPTRACKLVALVLQRNYDTYGLSIWGRGIENVPVENGNPGEHGLLVSEHIVMVDITAMHILLTVLKHIIKIQARRLAIQPHHDAQAQEISQKIIALIGKVTIILFATSFFLINEISGPVQSEIFSSFSIYGRK